MSRTPSLPPAVDRDSAAQRSRRNPFTDTGLERAAERREDAEWLRAREADPDSRYLLLDADGALLAARDTDTPFWADAALRRQHLPDAPASLLGVHDGRAHFALRLERTQSTTLVPELPVRRVDLRTAGSCFGGFEAGLFAYASALTHWQQLHRYCSQCGGSLALAAAGHRAQCQTCGRLQFPRTDPAIIVIVEHDGACLLGRQAHWDERRYSTLAGFVEPGEALEDAVRREVAEEAGVRVVDCDYHSSQPWPFPASLMLGFTARAADRHIQLRDGELEDARWFTPDEIVRGVGSGQLRLPSSVSVSWRLLEHWLRQRAGIELGELVEHRDGIRGRTA